MSTRRAVAGKPLNPLAMALRDHQAGRLDAAEHGYREILRRHPQSFDALHLLGTLRVQRGDFEGAARLIEQALELRDDFALAHYNLAQAYMRLRKLVEAVEQFRRSCELDPKHFESWNSRGRVCVELVMPKEARWCAEQALALNPRAPAPRQTLGMALSLAGDCDAALAQFDEVERSCGKDAITCNWRGICAFERAQWNEAIAHFEEAIALDSDMENAHINRVRAISASRNKEPEAMRAAYAELLERFPTPEARAGLLHAMQLCADWSELETRLPEVRRDIGPDTLALAPIAALCLLDEPDALRTVARCYARTRTFVRPTVEPLRPPAPRARLRIGYVSANFTSHPVGHSLRELFARHDRRRIEVVGIATGVNDGTVLREALIDACDEFYAVSTLSADSACSFLRALNLQVAIDLAGHTAEARPELFAARVAPVQANYFGFPGTWGHACMDYLIADPVVIPPGSESQYDEQIVRLPHTFFLTDTAVQPAASPGTRTAAGLPEQSFVFACFNTAHKILPEVFSVWMRLLAATPGSVLWLTPGPDVRAANLRREAAARGIDPERLVFAGYVDDRRDYLARPALADLFLDTLPYNAHSTARDALWAGLPVLTCAGRGFAARVCASLVRAAGLPELVTESLADYEAVARRLAQSPAELLALRERLARSRSMAPIFDMVARCRELEWAYDVMYRLALEGSPPRAIDVPQQLASI